MKKIIINIIITILIAFAYFYLFLPPINITTMDFWIYLILMLALFIFLNTKDLLFELNKTRNYKSFKASKTFKVLIAIIPTIILVILLINIIMSPLFMSSSYSKRISISEGLKFEEKVTPVDFNHVPLLDKDSTSKIGDRVMGEMTDLVSQFNVSNIYTQINYNNNIVRVTPLEYNGFIKYLTNKDKGVPGYITVNSVNGEADLVRLDKGMKYVPSAYFNNNMYRRLRFKYPTEIFGEETFEIDNEGNPYFIIPTIKYHGVDIREEITGVIIYNPITGSSERYSAGEVPTWVDHVYSADLILEEVDDWGLYNGGYWNSIFGQKNVVATTEGYNYMVQDDDVYLYTGITSVASDESNLGFILTNMRTKETNYYLIPGAEEYSAMASAEGQVQQMNYTSTFPLLINLNGKATYLVSLKDNAGLVKMYGFVDVQNYQKVVVTDANYGIKKASENYLNNVTLEEQQEQKEKEITVKTITSAIIDGNTYYYIFDGTDRYKVSIKVSDELPFITPGTKIKISFNDKNGIKDITKLSI